MKTSAKHELIETAKIQLDKNNPRIQRFLAMYGGDVTPEQIHLALGVGSDANQGGEAGTTFYSLRESIRTSGTIIQPIHVNRTTTGELVVIEGNTRVAIYREFEKTGVEGSWKHIPAIVYNNLPQEEIESIRLQSHLVGPRAWDPYSKARYLNKLHSEQDMPFDRLVDLCGGRKREVLEYVAAFNDMEEFYRPILDSDGDFDPTRFSGFVELQKPGIKLAITQAGFTNKDFAAWVADGKIDPLNTVRLLPQILRNKKLREVFLSDGAREAQKLLDAAPIDANLENEELESLCKATTVKLRKLAWADVRRLQQSPESDEVRAIVSLNEELKAFIDSNLHE